MRNKCIFSLEKLHKKCQIYQIYIKQITDSTSKILEAHTKLKEHRVTNINYMICIELQNSETQWK